jgi:hypothetical protein
MPSDGRHTLGDFLKDGRERVYLTCITCARTGNHSLAALICRYGEDITLTELLSELSHECPQRTSQALERCGVRFGKQ